MQKNPKNPKRDLLLIAISFLISGIALFAISIFSGSQIFSFIGLGLTFWGAIFLLVTPQRRVESSFLVSSTLPEYMAMDRMIKNLNLKKEAYNIPSCPRDVNLPEHLKCLNEMVTFIPVQKPEELTEIESLADEYLFENPKNLLIDIAEDKFLTEDPKGLLIPSPGISLLEKIERKHKTGLDKIPFSELDEKLPYLFKELYLSKEIKMTINGNQVTLQVNDCFYKDLYSQKHNLTSINIIGCPLVNAAACAIAKSVGKPTLIQDIKTTPNYKTITATLKIVNGMFEEEQKFVVDNEKIELRRNELLYVTNASMRVIDLSFDILFNLNCQRINWEQLDYYFKGFGVNLVFIGRSMPSLNLDFQKLSSAVKSQVPIETSKEVSNVLKALFEYFNSLNPHDDYTGNVPNFQSAKAIIMAYYTLNDLLLGKIVGDKDDKTENEQLENILQTLTTWSAFKIKTGELVESIQNINHVDSENDSDVNVENIRQIFKEQLNL
jgi:hypothetical protein